MHNKDLSKVKFITGSIYKTKEEQKINLNFFGRRLTVIKRKVKINDGDDDPVDGEYNAKQVSINEGDDALGDEFKTSDDDERFQKLNNKYFDIFENTRELTFTKTDHSLAEEMKEQFIEQNPYNNIVEDAKSDESFPSEENKDTIEPLTRAEALKAKEGQIKRKGKSYLCTIQRRKHLHDEGLYNDIMGSTIDRLVQTQKKAGNSYDDNDLFERKE